MFDRGRAHVVPADGSSDDGFSQDITQRAIWVGNPLVVVPSLQRLSAVKVREEILGDEKKDAGESFCEELREGFDH